jgi:hypothetical protein
MGAHVDGEMEKKTPAKTICGGKYAFSGWLAQFLPASFMKGLLEQVTGLDKVTEAVKAKKKPQLAAGPILHVFS